MAGGRRLPKRGLSVEAKLNVQFNGGLCIKLFLGFFIFFNIFFFLCHVYSS